MEGLRKTAQYCLQRHGTRLTHGSRVPHPRPFPFPLPRRLAKRASYVPAGSHARQLVSSSPRVERMPSGPVVQRTEKSTVPLPREERSGG